MFLACCRRTLSILLCILSMVFAKSPDKLVEWNLNWLIIFVAGCCRWFLFWNIEVFKSFGTCLIEIASSYFEYLNDKKKINNERTGWMKKKYFAIAQMLIKNAIGSYSQVAISNSAWNLFDTSIIHSLYALVKFNYTSNS